MSMNDASAIGARRWIADVKRWRREPEERIEPTLRRPDGPAAAPTLDLAAAQEATGGSELALRERTDGHHPRQSARPRSHQSQAPGLVRPSLPAQLALAATENATTYVQEITSETETLTSEVAELRRDVARLSEEVALLRKVAGAGIGPVERAVQKLAQRMDRLDGGARPAVIDRRPARDGGRESWFFRLFGPRR